MVSPFLESWLTFLKLERNADNLGREFLGGGGGLRPKQGPKNSRGKFAEEVRWEIRQQFPKFRRTKTKNWPQNPLCRASRLTYRKRKLGPKKTMTARKSDNFLHILGRFPCWIAQKTWRKSKDNSKNPMEPAPRKCRFLSQRWFVGNPLARNCPVFLLSWGFGVMSNYRDRIVLPEALLAITDTNLYPWGRTGLDRPFGTNRIQPWTFRRKSAL